MATGSLVFGIPPRNYNKKEKRFSVPFLSFLFLSDIFVFFQLEECAYCSSMSIQYFSQRYFTATGVSSLL